MIACGHSCGNRSTARRIRVVRAEPFRQLAAFENTLRLSAWASATSYLISRGRCRASERSDEPRDRSETAKRREREREGVRGRSHEDDTAVSDARRLARSIHQRGRQRERRKSLRRSRPRGRPRYIVVTPEMGDPDLLGDCRGHAFLAAKSERLQESPRRRAALTAVVGLIEYENAGQTTRARYGKYNAARSFGRRIVQRAHQRSSELP